MNRKIRKSIFIVFLVVFLLTVPLLIYYAMGYRYDFKNNIITFVGAISIDTTPKNATIFLNGKNANESSNLLSSQVFLKNLTPQLYNVRVEKEGYWTWEKNLTVLPRSVTKAEFIILFKKEPPIESLAQNIKKIDFSPSSNTIVYQILQPTTEECDPPPSNKCIATKSVNQIGIASFDGARIYDPVFFNIPFIRDYSVVSWSNNEREIVISDSANNTYYIISLNENNIERFPSELFFGNEPIKVSSPQFSPENSALVMFSYNKNLYLYERSLKKTSLLAEGIYALSHYENSFYYLKPDGIVYKNNHTFSNEIRLYSETLSGFNPVSDYSILVSESPLTSTPVIAVIEKNNRKLFWFLNKNSASPTQISDSVEGAQFSWDLKKILFRFKDKILVYYIDSIDEEPRHDAGEKEEVFISDVPITSTLWLTQQENYIVVVRNNLIEIVELDGRDKRNIVRFISATNLKSTFYYKNQKAIYILDGSQLKRIMLDY